MLPEYSLSDIIISNSQKLPFYIGTFEGTEDPDIDWPHRHNFYSIVWFTQGSGINVIDFEEYNIQPNRLFLTHPNQVHNWSFSEDVKGYILVFEKFFIENLPVGLMNVVKVDLNSKNNYLFKQIFENLLYEISLSDDISFKVIETGIHYIFAILSRVSSHLTKSDIPKPREISDFYKCITESISNNLPVTEYANRLNITVERLNEICKKYNNQTPKSIILDKKITEAKRLLFFTDLSVKEISFQLGFEDSSYFSRIFKQKTNLSPSDFKNKTT